MTKQELIKILDEKIENAENNLKMIMSDNNKRLLLVGEIQAYTDIKNLLKKEML